MKLLFLLYINIFLFFNPSIAELLPTKSEILKKSNECFNDPQKQLCKELILKMERIQLAEFEQKRFKCQSSILGLQSKLIEAYFFGNSSKLQNLAIYPYVIKNC